MKVVIREHSLCQKKGSRMQTGNKSRCINIPIFTKQCRYATEWFVFLSSLYGACPEKSESLWAKLKRSREQRKMKREQRKIRRDQGWKNAREG